MQLNSLISHITYESVQGSREPEITDICYHSGKVKPGALFVCIKGQNQDGHDFILDAIERGAAALVIENDIPEQRITVLRVKDTRTALAGLSAAFFDYPARKLKMIGITGTKGKTTTAFFVAGILREAGHRPGMMGTIWIDDGREKVPAEHTTPEASDIQRYLYRMTENGCDCCVMEVSSQGIKMQRVETIWFDIGIFLNIEPDHIGEGEHASFSEYLNCKRKLMQRCDIGIVNRDDPNVNRILFGHSCQVETFSMKHPSDIMADGEKYFMDRGRLYSSFEVFEDRKSLGTFSIALPGRFNIYNALAAMSAALHFDVTKEQISSALQKQSVPGRCENVSPSEVYTVLIDYAHNEMSLKNLLETLRRFEPGRLVVLFGCGGNRSKLRRNKMGETAGLLADVTILTTDNPRWEEPEAILDDIAEGILGTKGTYIKIPDRREAVQYAIETAEAGDLIVLSGKGHEPYQEICGKKYPMREAELVADAVAALDREKKRGK